jgi:hypothetical protein
MTTRAQFFFSVTVETLSGCNGIIEILRRIPDLLSTLALATAFVLDN